MSFPKLPLQSPRARGRSGAAAFFVPVWRWVRLGAAPGAIALLLMGSTIGCSGPINKGKAAMEQLQSSLPPGMGGTAFKSEKSLTALAEYLSSSNCKLYVAFWCPYCKKQEKMFGPAVAKLPRVECDPNGKNSQTALCNQAGVSGFPTWEVKGKLYPGLRSLDELADLSGYIGPRDAEN